MASEQQYVRIGKITTTILAIAVIIIAPFISRAGDGLFIILQEFSSIFNMPIFAVIIAGLLFRKVSAKAAKIGLLVGTSLYLLSKFGLDALDVEIHFLHRLCVAFFATIFSMLFLSKYYPNQNEFTIQNKGVVDVKNWKYVKPVSFIVVVLAILIYLFFSPIFI